MELLTQTQFNMLDIIYQHEYIFQKDKIYNIIDPNEKINNFDGLILSESDIIKQIKISNPSYIDINYYDKYYIRYTNNNNDVKISPLDLNSVHLLRLIGLNNIIGYSNLELNININYLHLSDILKSIYYFKDYSITDYCTVCGNLLNIKNIDIIQICSNQSCINKSKSMVISNIVTDYYKKDPIVCDFLINILIAGVSHPKKEKIFKPLPILNNINNFDEFKKILDINLNNLKTEIIAKSNSDIELFNQINSDAYGIIVNALSNNYFSLSTVQKFYTDVLYNTKVKVPKLYANNPFDSDNIKFIGFNYSFDIESKFKKEYFLFHGSPLHCWYPIIKNGLKVMSGTEFMTTGAAFGNGIYFSNSFNMSLGYSSGNCYNNLIAVGIFEINENIKKYEKSANIFVINNDTIMLLRYLVIINKNNCDTNNFNDISDYFCKYLGSINKINEKKIINIKNKRFNSELKLLNSNSKVKNVDIIDDITHWNVTLNDIECNIKNSYNNNYTDIGKIFISLDFYFNEYPKLPPKIILNSNLKKNIICDDSNNVILHELTPANWEITYNLSKLIDKIYDYISFNI